MMLCVLFIVGCHGGDVFKYRHANNPRLLQLHNQTRSERGLSLLLRNQELEQRAQDHAEWMARSGRLKHSRIGKTFSREGENIAWGSSTSEGTFDQWMNSDAHRNNILDKEFTNIGTGNAKSKHGYYWCIIFGNPV